MPSQEWFATGQLAFSKIFDLFCQLFDLLGFFDDGKRERGVRIDSLDLAFQVRNQLRELGHVGFDFDLILFFDGFDVGWAELGSVKARRKVLIGSVGRRTGRRRGANAVALECGEKRLGGENSRSAENGP